MRSALEITDALGLYAPTQEQQAIIEAPVTGSARVIAGAGSGKTETMALRVLWLVANEAVAPQEVLGLTFTKKAAGELAGRIQKRLRELHQRGLASPSDEFQSPLVSTYNSFGARLYRDHAVLLGRDPDARVLSEASAWTLATSVIQKSALPELATWDITVPQLVRVVRVLSSRLQENRVEFSQLEDFVSRFTTLADLPVGGRGVHKEVDEWVDKVGSLLPLMKLVEEFQEAKRVRGVLEFSDQIAFALQIAQGHPGIADTLRDRHRVVLLDEYQDTSVAQTTLLTELFSGHSVMAVGDPHQAIYGWRGASSSNLQDFVTHFAPVTTYSLRTSWRNGHQILAAANTIASPLRSLPGVEVETLTPSASATDEPVSVVFEETLADEARVVASWMKSELSGGDNARTAAIIVRARSHQKAFVDALHEQGVPVHVLGIGGLLDDPAIADIVCTLRVLSKPAAESELIRLLTGARWRLGVADVQALQHTATWLQGRDHHGVALPEDVATRMKRSVAGAHHPGLLDALAFMAGAPGDHSQWRHYSEVARERLVDIHRTLSSLAALRFGDVDSLVPAIESALGLDIEVEANPQRRSSRAARDAFHDAVQSYLSVSDEATILGFVQWLEDAERRDNLTPRQEPPEEGCVQVVTIHGAKGLEWDIVAVPRLVVDELPAKARETSAWLNRGELPYEFRGDTATLPVFAWQGASTRKELMANHQKFTDQVALHYGHEERRLMYVAITRAKHRLLLSGSWWAHHKESRAPSIFLSELEEAGLVGKLPITSVSDTPPDNAAEATWVWPADPLGSRRPAVESAAKLVREAMAGSPSVRDPRVAQVLHTRERARNPQAEPDLVIPVRVPASSLEKWVADPAAMRASLRRPLPHKPHLSALRGTRFHEWVEQHFDSGVGAPLLSLDDEVTDDPVDVIDWIEAFERSPFVSLTPIAIEKELHLPLGGHIVICKIDAVFELDNMIHIVDWKTGKEPSDADEVFRKSLQLSAYRAAWSSWKGIPEDSVTASFWYSGTGNLLTPENLPNRSELEELLLESWGG